MGVRNFDLRELFSGPDDPEPGMIWRTWWDGLEPKIPSYLAHLLWWDSYAAVDFFIAPDGDENVPEKYKVINDDVETADANLARDIEQYILRIEQLPTREENGYIGPYEFEHAAWDDGFLRQDYPRAIATYILRYFDLAIHGLLTENAALVAMSLAYAYTGMAFKREIRDESKAEQKLKNAYSLLGQKGGVAAHEKTRAMKTEAIRLYRERTDWPSKRQAL